MKYIYTTLMLFILAIGSANAQSCPDDSPTTGTVAGVRFAGEQVYLEWSTPALAQELYDALDASGNVVLDGKDGSGDVVNVTYPFSDLTLVTANNRVRSTSTNAGFNGKFSGDVTFNLADGSSFGCFYVEGLAGPICPDGPVNDDIAAAVSNGTSHQIYLEYENDADAAAMWSAMANSGTALTLNGAVNEGLANEEAVSISMPRSDMSNPGGNPFRIKSNIPVTTNENGTFTGTAVFGLDGGVSLECTFAVGILPVTLIDFDAVSVDNKMVEIKWITATEANTDFMVIERSTDGRNFSIIGQVAAAGYSDELRTYSIEDRTPLTGTNFYRLVTTDFDGSQQNSNVVSVEISNKTIINIYPTVVEESVNIDLSDFTSINEIVTVYDWNGRVVLHESLNTGGVNALNISKLLPGSYVLRVGQTHKKFIKK